MKKVGIVYDDIYIQHNTQGYFSHPERKERLIATKSLLEEHQFYGNNHLEQYVPISPRDATYEELEWVHDARLIKWVEDNVKKSSTQKLQYMDGDTPVSPQSLNAALKAAGGNFKAIDAIMNDKINRAFILCRPPGHHANAGRSRGFCLFNNLALDIHYLAKRKGIKRIGILDFDVHAGNGTEDIIWGGIPDTEVLFISTHQDPRTMYPGECFIEDIGSGKQEGKIVNVTFEPESGDDSMKAVLNELVKPMMTEFKPDFVLFSAGFDGHHADPIGSLSFTDQMFGEIINELNPIAEEFAKGRMLATLEGGYNIEALARSISNVISAMCNGKIIENDDEFSEIGYTEEFTRNDLIPKIKQILSPYWNCFQREYN